MAIANVLLDQGDEALGSNALASPKLTQHSMINLLANEMNERVKKGFLYGSLQKKVLIFYFNHNVMAMEFMKDLEEFKEKVRPLWKKNRMKEFLNFNKIEARVENRPPVRPKEPKRNPDIAKGNFVNGATDGAIFAEFEKLRRHIKEIQS